MKEITYTSIYNAFTVDNMNESTMCYQAQHVKDLLTYCMHVPGATITITVTNLSDTTSIQLYDQYAFVESLIEALYDFQFDMMPIENTDDDGPITSYVTVKAINLDVDVIKQLPEDIATMCFKAEMLKRHLFGIAEQALDDTSITICVKHTNGNTAIADLYDLPAFVDSLLSALQVFQNSEISNTLELEVPEGPYIPDDSDVTE